MRDVSGWEGPGERAEADFSHQRKMRINLGSKEETDEEVLGKFPFVFFPPSWQIMIRSRAVGFVPSFTNRGLRDTKSIHEAPLSLREGKNLKAKKSNWDLNSFPRRSSLPTVAAAVYAVP